jgi:linolenate 9R-lipoxygenase
MFVYLSFCFNSSQPDIPAHKYLASNRSYPVLVRHANIKGFKDDAIRDGRGLTLRLLAGDADAATDALDLHDAVLDVLTSTGPRFFLNNAMAFSQWVRSDLDGRGAMLIAYPKIVPIFEEIIKNPDSYTKLHYYSEPSYIFVAEDGSKFYMRYRIINADKSADTGSVPTEEVLMPQDYSPRPESDTRAETYLQDDFRSRVTSQSGVSYLLQLQLCEVSKNLAANEEKMDCTIPWDEYHFPMRDVALIHLDEVVPDEAVEPLNFSPFHAPAELGLVLASTAKDMASINHMRSVVYEFSAKNRNGQPLPDHLAALIPQRK